MSGRRSILAELIRSAPDPFQPVWVRMLQRLETSAMNGATPVGQYGSVRTTRPIQRTSIAADRTVVQGYGLLLRCHIEAGSHRADYQTCCNSHSHGAAKESRSGRCA